MTFFRSSLFAGCLTASFVFAACDGGSDPAAAGVDASRLDGSRAEGSVGGGGGSSGSDAGTDRMTQPPPVTLPPPPAPGPDSKLIAPGRVDIMGTHLSACTNQVPASGNGDRWCAFSLPGRMLGRAELWVVNVTAGASGAVKCDGTDANCKRLSENLWTGQPQAGPFYPTAHRFDGDTLIFHADAPAAVMDIYEGPIYAWRPGWDAPRQVSNGNLAITCEAHFEAEAVACVENINPATEMQLEFDLTAGRLDGKAHKVARIVPTRPGTRAGQWRFGFSADGNWFAYSTGGRTPAEAETLSVMRTDDLAEIGTNPASPKKMQVAAGVSRWSISADGAKWYYFREYNYNTEGNPSGTLVMSDFPSGQNETTLATNVGAFQVLFDGTPNDRGVGLFENVVAGRGAFVLIRDRSQPTMTVRVAANISSALLSEDLRYVYFSREFDANIGTSDAFVARSDGTNTCPLQSTPSSAVFGDPFPPAATVVVWADAIDLVEGTGEGWVASPEGCANKRRWAAGLDYWFFAGDRGLIYSEEAMADVATLKFVPIEGGTIGTPTEIQKQVFRIFAALPDSKSVLFTIDRGVSFDGLYLFAKVPF